MNKFSEPPLQGHRGHPRPAGALWPFEVQVRLCLRNTEAGCRQLETLELTFKVGMPGNMIIGHLLERSRWGLVDFPAMEQVE